jgi:hypothetical protein
VANPQPVLETGDNLAVMLPVMLGVTLGLGYAVHAVLRDKGLGIVGNGAFMMVGMAAGVVFMSFCQAYF